MSSLSLCQHAQAKTIGTKIVVEFGVQQKRPYPIQSSRITPGPTKGPMLA